MRIKLCYAAAIVLCLSYHVSGLAQSPPREPQGLRMQHTKDSKHDSVLIPWGSTVDQVKALRPRSKPDALGSTTALFCTAYSCSFLDSFVDGWRIDTGDVVFADRPSIEFNDGKFYKYSMLVNANSFDAMYDILSKALGSPSKSEDIPRQNAYGAKWTGVIRTWNTPNCEVTLTARLSRIDDGLMLVVYKPLAPPEKKPEGQAPF
jgi:hypothetical protein